MARRFQIMRCGGKRVSGPVLVENGLEPRSHRPEEMGHWANAHGAHGA